MPFVTSDSGAFPFVPAPRSDIGGDRPDATFRRAERGTAIAVIAVRAVFFAQLALAVPQGLAQASRPWVFGALSALALTESAVLAAFVWGRQRVSGTVALTDSGFAVFTIAAEPFYSGSADRVGTWGAWGFGAGCAATITVGAGMRRRRDAGAAAAMLAAAYLAVSLPTPRPGTAVVNSVAMVGFTAASHLVAAFLRELAGIADQARAAAAAAAREAEHERQRRLLHDQATVLSLLSRRHDDPVLEGSLRIQAATASQRIRAFLGDTRDVEPDAVLAQERPLLVDVIAAAVGDFSDLPLTVNTDLVLRVRVRSEQAEVLLAAIRTLLHNVRRHAGASTVTIHGDRTADARWVLSVTDDGVGFDPAATELGYGLRTQAGQALVAAGFAVDVDSAPGDGTRIAISCPEGPDDHR